MSDEAVVDEEVRVGRFAWLIPPDGWIRTMVQVIRELGEDNLTVVAAGVAFYFLLSVVPLLAAMISIYGLVADPALVQETVLSTAAVLPEGSQEVLESQLLRISAGGEDSLSLGVISGIGLSLWSAAYGTNALMAGLNVAYDARETRHVVVRYLTSFGLLGAGMLPTMLGITVIAIVPVLFAAFGIPGFRELFDAYLRWPVLGLAFLAYTMLLYRFGPARPAGRTAWVGPGALLATGLWIATSMGFTGYVSTFDTYTETYGSLAGVIVTLMWLWLTALVILIGAELNAELERQTHVAAAKLAT